jgi:hypothetical protein
VGATFEKRRHSGGPHDIFPIEGNFCIWQRVLPLTQLNGFHLTFENARRPMAPTLLLKKKVGSASPVAGRSARCKGLVHFWCGFYAFL